jgi:hypothetical protein
MRSSYNTVFTLPANALGPAEVMSREVKSAGQPCESKSADPLRYAPLKALGFVNTGTLCERSAKSKYI